MLSLVQGAQPVKPLLGVWLLRGTSGLSFCLPALRPWIVDPGECGPDALALQPGSP